MTGLEFKTSLNALTKTCRYFEDILRPRLFQRLTFKGDSVDLVARRQWCYEIQEGDERAVELAALVKECRFFKWFHTPESEAVRSLAEFTCILPHFVNVVSVQFGYTFMSPDILGHLIQMPRLTAVRFTQVLTSNIGNIYDAVLPTSPQWTHFENNVPLFATGEYMSSFIKKSQLSVLHTIVLTIGEPLFLGIQGPCLKELRLDFTMDVSLQIHLPQLWKMLENTPSLEVLTLDFEYKFREAFVASYSLSTAAIPRLHSLRCPGWVGLYIVKGRPLREIELIRHYRPGSLAVYGYTVDETSAIFDMLGQSTVGISHLTFPFVNDGELLGQFPASVATLTLEPPWREAAHLVHGLINLPLSMLIHTARCCSMSASESRACTAHRI
ncbi:hypothetical protein K474DRAFT_586692 [Panus rudis PR-1116 ss-1]|nr:hypothetical protein K474DRAFT_586692 [Panus rudis PR-1116 ss-1]